MVKQVSAVKTTADSHEFSLGSALCHQGPKCCEQVTAQIMKDSKNQQKMIKQRYLSLDNCSITRTLNRWSIEKIFIFFCSFLLDWCFMLSYFTYKTGRSPRETQDDLQKSLRKALPLENRFNIKFIHTHIHLCAGNTFTKPTCGSHGVDSALYVFEGDTEFVENRPAIQ